MQFSLMMSTLLASLVALLSLQTVLVDSSSLSVDRSKSEPQFRTLPLKRMEQRSDIHPQILLQMHINRGIRRLAKMTGAQPPSEESLEKRLQKRVLSLDAIDRHSDRFHGPREVQMEKRFNRAGVSNFRHKRQDRVAAAESPSADNSLGLDVESASGTSLELGYLATIQIGTPPQDFLILMDSGSADFWVGSEDCATLPPGSNCSIPGCGNHNFLGPQSSSSFSETPNPFLVAYGTGAVAGRVVTDNVEIAGLALPNHTFGVATVETENFSSGQSSFDGLMGLAKSSISNQQKPTPIESLASAGLVPAAVVSYKLSRLADNKNDGEITFGALDNSKFDSNTLVTVPNVNTQGFWEASLDSVSVDGVDLRLNGQRTTILDTGTTLTVIPNSDLTVIHKAIPGAHPDGQGGFNIPCNTTASVALTYGGQLFTVDPRDLAFQPVPHSNGICSSALASSASSASGDLNPADPNEWLLGDMFLKNAYFSTNVTANTMSLAKLI